MTGSRNRPRLIYVLDRFPAETLNFIYNEIDHLEAAGFGIDLVSLMPPIRCPAEAERFLARVRVIRPVALSALLRAWLHYLTRKPLTLLRLFITLPLDNDRPGKGLRTLSHLCVALRVAWLLRDRREHLHAHFASKAALTARVCADLNGNSYSFTAHGSATVHPPNRLCLRSKIHGAAFIVAVSEFNRRALLSHCPDYAADRVIVNRTGIRLEQFPYREPSAEPASPANLLCVASLFPIKNHETLIDACALLAGRGLAFRLHLVGKDVDGRRALLASRAARRGIAASLVFHGVVDHAGVADHLAAADLCLLSSRSEGIPVALMEAMASGLPVLGPRITGLSELIREGEWGELADPGDPREFADKMEAMLRGGKARIERSRRARRHIEEQFDMAANTDRLAAEFDRRLN